MNSSPRRLRLAFAGTPQFAVPVLDALRSGDHELAAVFTQADRAAGRGREVTESPVKQRAHELGLPVYQPLSFRSAEALEQLSALAVDAFIVVAYGLILPPEALAVPRLGCLNIHASLLPRWRGAAPIQRAIEAGDATTGVCIMRMEAGLDTGPVLARHAVAINLKDTSQSLALRLADAGAALISATLDALAEGPIEARAQADQGVTYASKIAKAEALVDWRADAALIARRVRAFNPWPVAETRFMERQLRLWEAEALDAPTRDAPPGTVLRVGTGIEVACGKGILRILRLQAPGRQVLDAQEFARAAPLSGATFTSA